MSAAREVSSVTFCPNLLPYVLVGMASGTVTEFSIGDSSKSSLIAPTSLRCRWRMEDDVYVRALRYLMYSPEESFAVAPSSTPQSSRSAVVLRAYDSVDFIDCWSGLYRKRLSLRNALASAMTYFEADQLRRDSYIRQLETTGPYIYVSFFADVDARLMSHKVLLIHADRTNVAAGVSKNSLEGQGAMVVSPPQRVLAAAGNGAKKPPVSWIATHPTASCMAVAHRCETLAALVFVYAAAADRRAVAFSTLSIGEGAVSSAGNNSRTSKARGSPSSLRSLAFVPTRPGQSALVAGFENLLLAVLTTQRLSVFDVSRSEGVELYLLRPPHEATFARMSTIVVDPYALLVQTTEGSMLHASFDDRDAALTRVMSCTSVEASPDHGFLLVDRDDTFSSWDLQLADVTYSGIFPSAAFLQNGFLSSYSLCQKNQLFRSFSSSWQHCGLTLQSTNLRRRQYLYAAIAAPRTPVSPSLHVTGKLDYCVVADAGLCLDARSIRISRAFYPLEDTEIPLDAVPNDAVTVLSRPHPVSLLALTAVFYQGVVFVAVLFQEREEGFDKKNVTRQATILGFESRSWAAMGTLHFSDVHDVVLHQDGSFCIVEAPRLGSFVLTHANLEINRGTSVGKLVYSSRNNKKWNESPTFLGARTIPVTATGSAMLVLHERVEKLKYSIVRCRGGKRFFQWTIPAAHATVHSFDVVLDAEGKCYVCTLLTRRSTLGEAKEPTLELWVDCFSPIPVGEDPPTNHSEENAGETAIGWKHHWTRCTRLGNSGATAARKGMQLFRRTVLVEEQDAIIGVCYFERALYGISRHGFVAPLALSSASSAEATEGLFLINHGNDVLIGFPVLTSFLLSARLQRQQHEHYVAATIVTSLTTDMAAIDSHSLTSSRLQQWAANRKELCSVVTGDSVIMRLEKLPEATVKVLHVMRSTEAMQHVRQDNDRTKQDSFNPSALRSVDHQLDASNAMQRLLHAVAMAQPHMGLLLPFMQALGLGFSATTVLEVEQQSATPRLFVLLERCRGNLSNGLKILAGLSLLDRSDSDAARQMAQLIWSQITDLPSRKGEEKGLRGINWLEVFASVDLRLLSDEAMLCLSRHPFLAQPKAESFHTVVHEASRSYWTSRLRECGMDGTTIVYLTEGHFSSCSFVNVPSELTFVASRNMERWMHATSAGHLQQPATASSGNGETLLHKARQASWSLQCVAPIADGQEILLRDVSQRICDLDAANIAEQLQWKPLNQAVKPMKGVLGASKAAHGVKHVSLPRGDSQSAGRVSPSPSPQKTALLAPADSTEQAAQQPNHAEQRPSQEQLRDQFRAAYRGASSDSDDESNQDEPLPSVAAAKPASKPAGRIRIHGGIVIQQQAAPQPAPDSAAEHSVMPSSNAAPQNSSSSQTILPNAESSTLVGARASRSFEPLFRSLQADTAAAAAAPSSRRRLTDSKERPEPTEVTSATAAATARPVGNNAALLSGAAAVRSAALHEFDKCNFDLAGRHFRGLLHMPGCSHDWKAEVAQHLAASTFLLSLPRYATTTTSTTSAGAGLFQLELRTPADEIKMARLFQFRFLERCHAHFACSLVRSVSTRTEAGWGELSQLLWSLIQYAHSQPPAESASSCASLPEEIVDDARRRVETRLLEGHHASNPDANVLLNLLLADTSAVDPQLDFLTLEPTLKDTVLIQCSECKGQFRRTPLCPFCNAAQ